MSWNADRYLNQNADLPRKTIFSKLKPISDPFLPSRLFTIPLDILEHLLDRLTKKDAFLAELKTGTETCPIANGTRS